MQPFSLAGQFQTSKKFSGPFKDWNPNCLNTQISFEALAGCMFYLNKCNDNFFDIDDIKSKISSVIHPNLTLRPFILRYTVLFL